MMPITCRMMQLSHKREEVCQGDSIGYHHRQAVLPPKDKLKCVKNTKKRLMLRLRAPPSGV